EGLKSDAPGSRSGSAEVLGDIGPHAGRAVPALIETLKDAEPTVRASAARAIGRQSSQAGAQAVPALREAAKDSDPTVAAKAADALTNLTNTTSAKTPLVRPTEGSAVENDTAGSEAAIAPAASTKVAKKPAPAKAKAKIPLKP